MKTKKLFLLATITALCFASPAMAQEPVKVHTEGLAAKTSSDPMDGTGAQSQLWSLGLDRERIARSDHTVGT